MANTFDPISISDPRVGTDFEAVHWPLGDGGDAPPANSAERIERRKIEFLAMYYALNRLYARLAAIRARASAEDDHPILQEIQIAIQDRDSLEDFYAPEGFLGEPVMDGVFYKDVEFTHARRREYYQTGSTSAFSVFVQLPPPGESAEQWLQEQRDKLFPPAPPES